MSNIKVVVSSKREKISEESTVKQESPINRPEKIFL